MRTPGQSGARAHLLILGPCFLPRGLVWLALATWAPLLGSLSMADPADKEKDKQRAARSRMLLAAGGGATTGPSGRDLLSTAVRATASTSERTHHLAPTVPVIPVAGAALVSPRNASPRSWPSQQAPPSPAPQKERPPPSSPALQKVGVGAMPSAPSAVPSVGIQREPSPSPHIGVEEVASPYDRGPSPGAKDQSPRKEPSPRRQSESTSGSVSPSGSTRERRLSVTSRTGTLRGAPVLENPGPLEQDKAQLALAKEAAERAEKAR